VLDTVKFVDAVPYVNSIYQISIVVDGGIS
jgi:hypothetical protein